MNGNHQNGNHENGDHLGVNGNGVVSSSEEVCVLKKAVTEEDAALPEQGQQVDQDNVQEETPINSQGHQKECEKKDKPVWLN